MNTLLQHSRRLGQVLTVLITILSVGLPGLAVAANPSAPFTPSQNIQDPGATTTPGTGGAGCGPSESNCYVDLTNSFSSITTTSDSTLGNDASDTTTIIGYLDLLAAKIKGTIALVFEGATINGVTTSFIITDPTAARSIVFPDASGTVQLSGTGGSFTTLSTSGTTSLATGGGTTTVGGNLTVAGATALNGNTIIGDAGTDTLTVNAATTFAALPSLPLTSANIFVGTGSNIATGVTLSGDATLNNAGVLTISNTAVTLAKLAADSVNSAKVVDDSIVNADINSAANIALSKLASGSSIVTSLTTPSGSSTNGGSISANVLTLSLADGTNPGLVSTSTQTLAGAKTFTSPVTGASFIPSSSSIPTNGLFLPAADSLALATASAERMRIDSGGNIGVGTTSPNALLDINGDLDVRGTLNFKKDSGTAFSVPGSVLADGVPFNFTQGSTAFSNGPVSETNYNDDIVAWGFNIAAPNVKIVPAQPAGWLSFERKFYQSGQMMSEYHLSHNGTDGTEKRLWSYLASHDGSYIFGSQMTSKLSFQSPNTATERLQFDWTDPSNGNINFGTGTMLKIQQNNVASMQQLNAAGTSYVSGPFLNASNQWQFAGPVYSVNSIAGTPAFDAVATTMSAGQALFRGQGSLASAGNIDALNFVLSVNGGVRAIIQNNGNYTNASAELRLHSLYGNSGADTKLVWENFGVGGTAAAFSAGIDQSDGTRWKLSNSNSLGTNDRLSVDTTGNLRLYAYGAGTLTTDASGNVTASSDERLKNIDGTFTRGITALTGITPINFHWNEISGLDRDHPYTGFSAQNIQASIPEAVSTDPRGNLALSDRPILATVINAINQITSLSSPFRTTLASWLGEDTNGLTAVVADQLCARKSDGTKICLTGDQLAGLVANSTHPAALTSDTEPPVLHINGADQESITQGSAWADLGASATDNVELAGDVTASVNGGAPSLAGSAVIDTTQPGTYSIVYSARDTSGNTSSVTRVVTVTDPSGAQN